MLPRLAVILGQMAFGSKIGEQTWRDVSCGASSSSDKCASDCEPSTGDVDKTVWRYTVTTQQLVLCIDTMSSYNPRKVMYNRSLHIYRSESLTLRTNSHLGLLGPELEKGVTGSHLTVDCFSSIKESAPSVDKEYGNFILLLGGDGD